jgi:glycosyltransferase involved in cell wall biosynthesis
LSAIAKPHRLACIVTHPIQYQAPMFRYLAAEPSIDLTVFFLSGVSTGPYYDRDFRVRVDWDTPLGGYPHRFLTPPDGDRGLSFWRPAVHGLWRLLAEGEFDALWVHGYGHQALLRTILYARAHGVSVMLRGDSRFGARSASGIKSRIKRALLPRLYQLIDAFLAIGSSNRDHYRAFGIPGHRIFMTPYAVDNDFFASRAGAASARREALRAQMGLQSGRPVILYAGKLQRLKRVHDLIAVCAAIKNERPKLAPNLLIVGDGEERMALEGCACAFQLDTVRFAGFRNQTELPALYDLCDLFVLPSDNEAWGLVLNEAMNAGKPVIASDQVGAARDLIRAGVNGHVYPAGDLAALRGRIVDILSDRERAARMGRASREIIREWSFAADRIGLLNALEWLASVRAPKNRYLHVTYAS